MCSPLRDFDLQGLSSIVSSPYNPPPAGSDDRHQGVDFAYYNRNGNGSIDGEVVNALLPGKVVGIVNGRLPYGNTVVIETRYTDIAAALAAALSITKEKSVYHLYAHLKNPPALALGQRVKCGEFIGNVGNSGTVIPHLHLEMRMGAAGGWFPSMGYFDDDASEEEKANYVYWRISGVYQHIDPIKFIEAYLNYEKQ